MFYKYPETVALNRRPEILAVREVIATEKLHGTNFRVYFPDAMTSIDEDMPLLVRAVVDDLRKECSAEWEALEAQGFDEKLIRGAVSKTLASVYRAMLLESGA